MPAGHLSYRQINNHWPEIEPLLRSNSRIGENNVPTHLSGLASARIESEIEAMSAEELMNLIENIVARLEMPD